MGQEGEEGKEGEKNEEEEEKEERESIENGERTGRRGRAKEGGQKRQRRSSSRRKLGQLLVGQSIEQRVQRSKCRAEQQEEGHEELLRSKRCKGGGADIIRKLRNVFTHANTCLKIIRDMHSNKAAERA